MDLFGFNHNSDENPSGTAVALNNVIAIVAILGLLCVALFLLFWQRKVSPNEVQVAHQV